MPWIFGGFADIEIPNLIIRRQDFPSRKDNCSSRKNSLSKLPRASDAAMWRGFVRRSYEHVFFVVVVGWIVFQLGSGCRDVPQNARKHSNLRCVNPRKSQPLAIVGGSRLGRFTVLLFSMGAFKAIMCTRTIIYTPVSTNRAGWKWRRIESM